MNAALAQTANEVVALLEAFWLWLARGQCRIKDRRGRLVPLQPNVLQTRVYETMYEQAVAGEPVRIFILKYRKAGISTFIMAFCFFVIRFYPHMAAQVLAHTDVSTHDIFEYAARMHVEHPGEPARPLWPGGHVLDFSDARDSRLACRTLGGRFVLSAANLQILNVSELPKVDMDRAALEDQLLSVLSAVAQEPGTFVILDGTANRADLSGVFEQRAKEARAGRGPFRLVFGAWFEEPSYTLDGPPLEPLEDATERAAEEELLAAQPTLTEGQLRWRRNMIIYLGGLVFFNQEYPDCFENAFQVAAGKLFPALREARHTAVYGVGELVAQGYTFYRAFDWGGVNPFVSLLLAHKAPPKLAPAEAAWLLAGAGSGPVYLPDRRPRFTLDLAACPETWRELTHLHWKNGRPAGDDHAVDALRYAVTFWHMSGHVHVVSEVYDASFTARGEDVGHNAAKVLRQTGGLAIAGSVGDRSRPDCLTAFRNRGIPVQPYNLTGEFTTGQEVLSGLGKLNQLIVASAPMQAAPPPVTRDEINRRRTARTGYRFGYVDFAELAAGEERPATRRPSGGAVLPRYW